MRNESTTPDTFYVGGKWAHDTRTAVVAMDPLPGVSLGLTLSTRAGNMESSVRLTLEQAQALHEAIGDAIDWLTTIDSRKAAAEAQARREADELAEDAAAAAPRKPLPNFLVNGSAL